MIRKIRCKNNSGYSLIELLVYIALVSIVSVSLYQVLILNMQVYTSIENTMTTDQDLTAAVNLITREIRMAGCDPEETQKMGFIEDGANADLNTDSDSIHFTRDLNSDGRHTGIGEDIAYYLKAGADGELALVRRADYQGAGNLEEVPLIENVRDLSFVYYQQNGTSLATDPMEIQIVEVSLTVDTGAMDALTHEPKVRAVTARVHVRNA